MRLSLEKALPIDEKLFHQSNVFELFKSILLNAAASCIDPNKSNEQRLYSHYDAYMDLLALIVNEKNKSNNEPWIITLEDLN